MFLSGSTGYGGDVKVANFTPTILTGRSVVDAHCALLLNSNPGRTFFIFSTDEFKVYYFSGIAIFYGGASGYVIDNGQIIQAAIDPAIAGFPIKKVLASTGDTFAVLFGAPFSCCFIPTTAKSSLAQRAEGCKFGARIVMASWAAPPRLRQWQRGSPLPCLGQADRTKPSMMPRLDICIHCYVPIPALCILPD